MPVKLFVVVVIALSWASVGEARTLPDCETILPFEGNEAPEGPFPAYEPLVMPGAWGGTVGCYMGPGADATLFGVYGERLSDADGQERLMLYGRGDLILLVRPSGSTERWRTVAACFGPARVPWRCNAGVTEGGGPVLTKTFSPAGTLMDGALSFGVREGTVPERFLALFEQTAASNRTVTLGIAGSNRAWTFRPDTPGGSRFVLSLAEHPDVLEALYRPNQPLELRITLDRPVEGQRQEVTFRQEIPLSHLGQVLSLLAQMEILTQAGFEASKDITF